jgi:putative NADH-flavin reductase
MSMNVAIIGASGRVGRCLVEQAIAEGHHVTAAVRNPATVDRPHERLRVVTCDVLDAAAVSRTIEGQDVVCCTLGEKSRRPTTLYSKGARNILLGMQTNSVRRLIFLSNFGILNEKAEDVGGALLLFLVRRFIRHTLDDHRRAFQDIRAHAPEWIVVRPLALSNGHSTRRYRVSADRIPAKGWKVSRADVAHFMLRQATENDYLNQSPAIAY